MNIDKVIASYNAKNKEKINKSKLGLILFPALTRSAASMRVHRLCMDRCVVSGKTLEKICDTLNCSPNDLF